MKIGLEVHVALPTKTKLFCSCSTSAQEPNTAICPICVGFPGSKPMLNKEAVSIALSIANALKCRINNRPSFIRKIYFYPDLPKSYQITQLEGAIGKEGHLECETESKKFTVGIRRIQIEEDPAKMIRSDDYTLLDFNRSGQPLVEIVTEPDITDEEGLKAFVNELRSVLYYLGVDIAKEIKIDLNISLGKSRVEVKNITGIKNLLDAAKYEASRQSKLMEEKKEVAAETRAYNEHKLTTMPLREKESDEEYGFIYEPDLASYSLKGIKSIEPTYARVIADQYSKKYKANANTIKELILFNKRALELIEHAKENYPMPAIINGIEILQKYEKMIVANTVFDKLLKILGTGGYIQDGTIEKLEKNQRIDINKDVIKVEDIDKEISCLINENRALIKDYKKNQKTFNFIVGQVIKKYNINPKYVAERLQALLKEIGEVE